MRFLSCVSSPMIASKFMAIIIPYRPGVVTTYPHELPSAPTFPVLAAFCLWRSVTVISGHNHDFRSF